MMKKALVIGIDEYVEFPLKKCVNDALSVSELLEKNANNDPNFSVVTITSRNSTVNNGLLTSAVEDLFSGDAETALLYFAGHGILDRTTDAGYIVAQDGRKGSWGLSFGHILSLANKAYPKIKSSVIILDCCYSGYAGEIAALGNPQVSLIGTGVTILTASHREGLAEEGIKHGLFTEIILHGLRGAAADILGNVTPAALYSLVDQTLGPWGQRPIYKANVQTFVTLRQVTPKIPKEVLRELPTLFPDETSSFQLDPSFEPARDNVPPEIMAIPPNPENVRIFKILQACNRNGLVEAVGTDFMYYAAIEYKSCRLTPVGVHYRKMAEIKRI
jgi:hypothetical protein